ncbi:hypothetical protein ACL02U_30015 [Streptomyces sp. MS06]|uniref:hypothetical protein n=1 Tax=Streptomyces sp. MS06 TaxID=3385974 RepID=UPI0039A2422E
MKPTTRGTLAAALTCAAAAASVAPAAAVSVVPVPLPLDGIGQSLNMELPELTGEVPVPMPGAPEGPRYTEGHLIPQRAVPQLPLGAGLPGADLRAPLPHLLGDDFDHAALDAPASDIRTLGPGVNLDAPLTAPDPDDFGLPGPKLPEVGVVTPVLQAVPGADLGMAPGL